jgi:hypothetical protein
MAEATRHDTTDKGALSPNAKPLPKPGTHFKPIQLHRRSFRITLPDHVSPNDPASLFLLYFSPEMIQMIAQNTNDYVPNTPELLAEHTREKEWFRMLPGELYIYLAIRIYITLFIQDEIASYWEDKLDHDIVNYIARNRFQALHMRYRISKAGVATPYQKEYKVLSVY